LRLVNRVYAMAALSAALSSAGPAAASKTERGSVGRRCAQRGLASYQGGGRKVGSAHADKLMLVKVRYKRPEANASVLFSGAGPLL
jgi:hypothetical protein